MRSARIARATSISVLVLYLLYYSASGWARVPITIDRFTYLVVPGDPLLGSYVYDYVALIIATLVYASTTSVRALIAIPILPLSLYILSESGDPVYLLMIPLQAGAAIALSRPRPQWVLEGFLGASTALSIASLASIYHFATGAGLGPVRGFVLPLRIFWGSIGALSVILLIFAGLVSPFRKAEGEPRCGGYSAGKALLPIALIIPPLEVIATHLPTVDPDLAPVSVDTYFYVYFIQLVASKGLWEALGEFSLARPVYLVAIYYLHRVVGDPVVLMDIAHPILALELLVLATYYTASKLYGKGWAGWIALLASAGHSSLGFIAGGYQANSIALPLATLLLVMRPGVISYLLLQATVLIHPWTFAMYSTVWIAASLASKRLRETSYKALEALASLAFGEMINRALTGSGAAEPIAGVASEVLWNIKPLWNLDGIANIYYGYTLYAWGSIYTAPIIALTLYSMLRGLPREVSAALLVSSIGALISTGSQDLIHRIYLNTPLELASQPALGAITRANKHAPTIIALTAISWSMVTLAGLTPLRGMPWEAIAKIR